MLISQKKLPSTFCSSEIGAFVCPWFLCRDRKQINKLPALEQVNEGNKKTQVVLDGDTRGRKVKWDIWQRQGLSIRIKKKKK